jgi:hypothetical protein
MASNDNRRPVKLVVQTSPDDPDHIFVAMNRPDAIAGLDREQAEAVGSQLLKWAQRRIFISYRRSDAITREMLRVYAAGRYGTGSFGESQ